MQTIQLPELSIIFIPTVFLLAVMLRYQLNAWVRLYPSARMFLQLLLVVFLSPLYSKPHHPWSL